MDMGRDMKQKTIFIRRNEIPICNCGRDYIAKFSLNSYVGKSLKKFAVVCRECIHLFGDLLMNSKLVFIQQKEDEKIPEFLERINTDEKQSAIFK